MKKFDMLIYTNQGIFDTIEGMLLYSKGDILPLTAIKNTYNIASFNGKTLYHCRIDLQTLIDLKNSIDTNDFESWDAVAELGIHDIYAGRTIEQAKLIFPELAGTRLEEIDGEQVEVPIIMANDIL